MLRQCLPASVAGSSLGDPPKLPKGVRTAAAGVVALMLWVLPLDAQDRAVRPRTTYEDLQMFTGVFNQIRVNHPDSMDSHAMVLAGIRGMIASVDPHSFLIPSARLNADKEKEWRAGRLHPVPIDFAFFGGSPVVVSVAPGSSAAKADILRGDELIAIEGQPVVAESTLELDVVLAGRRNSRVMLTFARRRVDGSYVELERDVRRERVGEETAVPAAFMLDAETGYVRITTFMGTKVNEDLRRVLSTLERQGMQRLVLDLRDNGGGSVDEAAQIAGTFLPNGAIIYMSEGRKSDVADTGRVRRSFLSSGQRKYPMVVMINSGSASASELVAGALQDHDRALIVGRPSFGKALLMRGFPLPDGSVFVMTIGHVKTPCGRVVQRQYRGVRPRDYYRLARAERDTVGRPTCKTTGGRTVYGGGGIYPDVRIAEPAPDPLWMARAAEQAVFMRWVGGYLNDNPAAFTTPEALAANMKLSPAALEDFRRFASGERVHIPEDAESLAILERVLIHWIAETKWGEQGLYRVAAVGDSEIAAALEAFARAAEILR